VRAQSSACASCCVGVPAVALTVLRKAPPPLLNRPHQFPLFRADSAEGRLYECAKVNRHRCIRVNTILIR
jgi:hypothetical protein